MKIEEEKTTIQHEYIWNFAYGLAHTNEFKMVRMANHLELFMCRSFRI